MRCSFFFFFFFCNVECTVYTWCWVLHEEPQINQPPKETMNRNILYIFYFLQLFAIEECFASLCKRLINGKSLINIWMHVLANVWLEIVWSEMPFAIHWTKIRHVCKEFYCFRDCRSGMRTIQWKRIIFFFFEFRMRKSIHWMTRLWCR